MSQCNEVLRYLRRRKGLTTWQAIQMFRCTRLARVIHDLRRSHTIHSEMRKLGNGKRIAVYSWGR